ncbi:creatininase family protein [Pelagibacterium lacus]|uniref:Creatininase family protein n=1 Tax=Pelagibacterium lacus TaxID=2282655 RepID=A0A369W206_9HYPH|nr:creatininase family protein [Pelagibacterium lacus]
MFCDGASLLSLVRLDEIDQLDGVSLGARSIAIVPVAATEAHGPHLPASTDCDIAEGHLGALAAYLPASIDAVVLPVQRIGASREHLEFAGTRSREEGDLIVDWFAIAASIAEAGGKRAVFVSSHGGNSAVVDSVILKARAELGMLAVGTAWLRFGQPEGLFSDTERRLGIHGGAIETSLMLHYAPHLVAMEQAEDFGSALAQIEAGMHHLSAFGRHRFGWLSSDLNPAGVVGDAQAASAGKGAALAEHILTSFAQLLEDVERFDLDRLAGRDRQEGRQ